MCRDFLRDLELQLRTGHQNRVYNQVNQEQTPAGVQEQVIVQEILDVVNSLLPVEEFDEPVFNKTFMNRSLQGIVENLAVQEQAVVQEDPELQVMERIHEQIVDITGLVNTHFSSFAVEASVSQVVVWLPLFEEFIALVYNLVYREQIVAGEMTQNIIENSAVQEQVIVPEIPLVVVAHSAHED